MVLGAASTLLWHCRQAGLVMRSGRAMNSDGPVAVTRWPMASVIVALLRNWLTTSTSQSTARSRGLVGFSVASLYAKSGYFFCSVDSTSTAE